MFLVFLCVVAIVLWGILVATAYITYLVRHSNHGKKHLQKKEKVCLCTVLGSGGHTTEMIALIKELGAEYTPRNYIIAETDLMSEDKVRAFEEQRNSGSYKIWKIPRSREVGQSYVSSVFTTAAAFWSALQQVWKISPDLLVLNGPGTCIPVAFAAAIYDMLRLRDTVIIYEESICRVKKLSLSAAILYYSALADDVIVQWRELKTRCMRASLIDDLPEKNICPSITVDPSVD